MSEPSLGEMFNLTKTATPAKKVGAGPRSQSEQTAASPEPARPARAAADNASPPKSLRQGSRRTARSTKDTDRPRTVHAVPDVADPAPTELAHEETPPPNSSDSSDSSPAATTPGERATPAKSTSPGVGGRASIMLYTTPTVEQAMREEAANSSLTYGQLTLICVENTLDQLRDTFAARAGVTSRLFSTNYQHRTREGQEKRTAGLNLHIARADLEIVDGLWPEMPGCKSRNDFLSTACSLHLLKETDT